MKTMPRGIWLWSLLGTIACLPAPTALAGLKFNLDSGSTFTPLGGPPQPLSGSFEWMPYDTGVSTTLGMMPVALHFETPTITFDLDPNPPNPWLTTTSIFPETGTTFFGANATGLSGTFPSGAYVMMTSWTDGLGTFTGPPDHPTHVSYPWVETGPVMGMSSHWIGRLAFSATAVAAEVIPEPRDFGLISLGVFALPTAVWIRVRRQRRKPAGCG